MNYEQVKDKLLSKGIFVLDKRIPAKEIMYLVNCGYKVLFAFWNHKMGSQLKGEYYTIVLDTIVLEDVDEEELHNVCKNISYVPKVIIRYAKQSGIKYNGLVDEHCLNPNFNALSIVIVLKNSINSSSENSLIYSSISSKYSFCASLIVFFIFPSSKSIKYKF